MNKKKILITPGIYQDKNRMIYYRLDLNWYSFAKKNNFEIVCSFNFNQVKNLILNNKIDGIIFSGGGNISKIQKNKINSMRDSFEIKIIKLAIKKKINSLFVCRGMQLLANFNKLKLSKVDGHVRRNHKIYLNKKYLGTNKKSIITNSFHNYSIFKTNGKFNVLAHHKDGSIEMMKKNNFLAMMFHPERKSYNQEFINSIIKKSFNASNFISGRKK